MECGARWFARPHIVAGSVVAPPARSAKGAAAMVELPRSICVSSRRGRRGLLGMSGHPGFARACR